MLICIGDEDGKVLDDLGGAVTERPIEFSFNTTHIFTL